MKALTNQNCLRRSEGALRAIRSGGSECRIVANLEPRKLRGIMSEGMILAADDGEGGVKVLTTEGDILSGSRVR